MNKLFGYPGGKWPIRHLVVSNFPEHTTYVDVFGGSAAILITKEPAKGEVFNDKNEEIVNFFRVVKHRPAELVERARHWIHSRSLWLDHKKASPPFDEIERAFRFWVLLSDSFGGKGVNFGTTRMGIRSVTHAREYLDEVARRLKDVQIECLDFRKCLRTFDSPETFFYLDPPYRGTRGGSSNYDLLSDDDWREMRDVLTSIKGKFLMSSGSDKFIARLFGLFYLKEISVRVMLPRSKKSAPRKELLIANYNISLKKRSTGLQQARAAMLRKQDRGNVRSRHGSKVKETVNERNA